MSKGTEPRNLRCVNNFFLSLVPGGVGGERDRSDNSMKTLRSRRTVDAEEAMAKGLGAWRANCVYLAILPKASAA